MPPLQGSGVGAGGAEVWGGRVGSGSEGAEGSALGRVVPGALWGATRTLRTSGASVPASGGGRGLALVPAHFAEDPAETRAAAGLPLPPHPTPDCEEPAPRPRSPKKHGHAPPRPPTAPRDSLTQRPRGPGSAALCWAKRAGQPPVCPARPAPGGLPSAGNAETWQDGAWGWGPGPGPGWVKCAPV